MDKSSAIELEMKQMDINFDQLRTSQDSKILMNMQRIEKTNKLNEANTDSINR